MDFPKIHVILTDYRKFYSFLPQQNQLKLSSAREQNDLELSSIRSTVKCEKRGRDNEHAAFTTKITYHGIFSDLV